MIITLHKDDIIEVFGWVMLEKLNPGRYRIKNVGTINGFPTYAFARPKGTKTISTHYCASVDPWLRVSVTDPDINKIVCINCPLPSLSPAKPVFRPPDYLQPGTACPIDACGQPLATALDGRYTYLRCPAGHNHFIRTKCYVTGCREVATRSDLIPGHGYVLVCGDHRWA